MFSGRLPFRSELCKKYFVVLIRIHVDNKYVIHRYLDSVINLKFAL